MRKHRRGVFGRQLLESLGLSSTVKQAPAATAPARYSRLMETLEPRAMMTAVGAAVPNLQLLQSMADIVQPYASASPSGLTPAQLRHAYGIDNVSFGSIIGDGAGQTIAIVDAYHNPNIASDLHMFDLAFGLSDPVLTVIGQTGSTTALPGTDPAGKGWSWALETALDVQWAHAVAPAANILLVEANSSSYGDLFTAINTARNYAGVSVISMSWGSGEFSGQTYYDSYFTTPAGHNGVTFVASSGDYGAYAYGTSTLSASYPATSPNVLSVGGTYLTLDSAGNWVAESGWGSGAGSGTSGGSGGGISLYESQPAYQNGVVTQSTTKRTAPDVAMDASPYSGVAVYDSWDFGSTSPWVVVGGTSLSSPLWAGVVALVNQGRALNGLSSLDGKTQTLPAIYSLPQSDFHDITSGNNGYPAGVGYDLVTGRGSPIVNLLVADMVGSVSVAPPTPTIGSLSVNPTSVTTGATVTLTASNVQETGGTIAGVALYRESSGSSGLQTSGDVFVGNAVFDGTNWTLSTATDGFGAGNYTYYAVAYDASNVASNTASAVLQVTAPAPANDNFANAEVLSGSDLTITGTNVNATKEPGEPTISKDKGGRSVWYVWTPATSGTVTLDTSGSNFNTLLGVYTGASVSALKQVAANNDVSRKDKTSVITFTAVAGVTYRIAVDGSRGAAGQIVLNMSPVIAAVTGGGSSGHGKKNSSLSFAATAPAFTVPTSPLFSPSVSLNFSSMRAWLRDVDQSLFDFDAQAA